jgi:hypothetical protein
MKMSKEHYIELMKAYSDARETLEIHALYLKNNPSLYKKYEVRLAWDCLHYTKIIVKIYEGFTYVDSHLQTASIKALKELGIL